MSLKTLEFKIKAAFFALFHIFLKKARPGFSRLDRERLNKILILRPDRIGDSVCSLPLIDRIKKDFPDLKLAVLASPKNVGIMSRDPRFDKIYLYRRHIFRDIATVMKIRRERYDAVVDLLADDSVTTLFLSQLTVGDKPRIGVGKKRYARYYDYNYDPGPDCPEHTIDINLKLIEAFGIVDTHPDGYAPPYIDRAARDKADRFYRELAADGKTRLKVGINLSMRGPNRDWGHDNFKGLVDRLLKDFEPCRIIIITAPPDRRKGDRLQDEFGSAVDQVPPDCNLTEISAILAGLDILISPDTSLVHIARSFEVPVVGLYPEYRQVYRQWRPYGQDDGLVLSYGGDNVFSITVDQVYEAFLGLVRKCRAATEA